MLLPWILCGILSAIIIILCIKNYLFKKSVAEICTELAEHLKTGTNTLISVSSCDKHIRLLAAELNKQLRLLRKQRRQYQSGDRALKDEVTNISHDIRTPLTAICGYLDLLQNEDKSENATRYLALIENRTQALKQLTEELFKYSVIISAQEPMQVEAVIVNGVLEESIATFYAALTERGISPEIAITEKQIVRYVNKAALMRILGNILSNALKYSDGDLKIELLESGELVFSNTARNLNEVQVGRLFNRFFSVEAARISTGLGLAISKTLVEQMGGTITAQYKNEKLVLRCNLSESLKDDIMV